MYLTESECDDGNVHLIGSRNSSEGRVEVCLKGGWVAVCDVMWNDRHAATVCRQLGHEGRESASIIISS